MPISASNEKRGKLEAADVVEDKRKSGTVVRYRDRYTEQVAFGLTLALRRPERPLASFRKVEKRRDLRGYATRGRAGVDEGPSGKTG